MMPADWTAFGSTVMASFLASLVECVEALTVVLAVGTVRGWRDTLFGCTAALVVLLLAVALLGQLLAPIPRDALHLVVGSLVLLFGLRWLYKAILRSAGTLPRHDEVGLFIRQQRGLQAMTPGTTGRDTLAFVLAFKAVLLEGAEVVFIVVALSANDASLLWPASIGAVAAWMLVMALGLIVHRPLSRVPENSLKFVVGVLLSAFGTFWLGEGVGMTWPWHDMALPGLTVAYLMLAWLCIGLCRHRINTKSVRSHR